MPLHRLREHFAVVLAYLYLFMGRQDSTTLLAASDFGIDHQFLWLRLTEKQRKHLGHRRIVRIPVAPPPSRGVTSAIPRVVALARRFLRSKQEVTPFLFQLGEEGPPTTVHMSAWVARTLAAYGIVAPQGFAYLGHSLRSGASSAIEAIRVPSSQGQGRLAGRLGTGHHHQRQQALH